MLTLYRLAFRAEMKNYPLQCDQQRHETGTSRSHSWMEHRTRAVGWEGFELGGTQQSLIREGYAPKINSLPFLGRGSYCLTLRRTPKPIREVTIHLQDRRGAAQLRVVTEIARNHQFCVNRGPIGYAELYSVGSHALGCGERELGCNYKNLMLKVSLREREMGWVGTRLYK